MECCDSFKMNSVSLLDLNKSILINVCISGVPTDDEQATGLERHALEALKHGKVFSYITSIFFLNVITAFIF